MYAVKEIFYTLQGEGAHTGRPAVFCRFAGCNLWSGREADRASAICQFCDTDFADTNGPGGGKFMQAADLATAVMETWPAGAGGSRFVVCTGGEPLLQMNAPLIDSLHAYDFEIAVETNGTIEAPPGLDWICVSPKAGAALKQRTGDELKLVYPQSSPQTPQSGPQTGLDPDAFESLAFRHFFLQPMDGPSREANTQAALRYCLEHPRWRLSLQTHKLLGIP